MMYLKLIGKNPKSKKKMMEVDGDNLNEIIRSLNLLSDQATEYYRRNMADVGALVAVLINKGIITQEEWNRQRLRCTAALDQVITAEQDTVEP